MAHPVFSLLGHAAHLGHGLKRIWNCRTIEEQLRTIK